jgi:predicted Zn-dependent protease
MYRSTTHFPILALSLIPFAAGCGGSDQTRTTSSSAGATPTVSATATEVREDPSTATPVSYETAESAFAQRRYPEATELFTAYTTAHAENPWGHYMLGISAWKAGEPEKAVAAFDQALSLDPDHRKSLFNSSRVLLENGHPKEALERIQKALTLEPMSNEGLRLLGRARHEVGNVDEAIQAYYRALSVDDRDVWSMNNLGLIYIQQDRSSEAIPPLARAVELRDNSPVFQNNLATALERSGYPAAAAEAYEAALAVDSTYAKASVGLARVTGAGQQPEETVVDLGALSLKFQSELESRRDTAAVSDSAAGPGPVVTDTTAVLDGMAGDSILVSGGEVSDTLEECESEEDL